jgi:replicative DNA helicase
MTLNSIANYGGTFQTRVLAALLTNKVFLQNILDVLSDEYFDNQGVKWIIQQIIKYYEKYNCNISMEVLKIELKKIENEVLQVSIREQLKSAYEASEEDLVYYEEEFAGFCKNQQVKKALLNSVDLLKAGQYDDIRNVLNNALKAGQPRDVGMEYEKDVESRYREDNRNPVAFPWKAFNNITQGGYGKGDLILIFGNPKGGKSWVTIAMACEAARAGKNVTFYALELSQDYVGKRMDAYFTGIPVDQIDKHKDEVEEAMKFIPGRIIVKGYPPKRASLSTLEAHQQQLRDRNDFVSEVIFIDYLDLLKNRAVRKERKEEIDDVYTDAKGWAVELGVPIISPSQANRSGAEKEILESTHIAGSFDKIMIGDIVISLARGRKDRLNGTGRFHIMGNRYGVDGVTFAAKIDTSNGHIEIEEEFMDVESGPENQPFEKNKFDSSEKNFLSSKMKLLKQEE